MQGIETKDGSKHTAATDRHGFHQCRSEVCWQIRRQLDDKQGGDIIVMMEGVRDAIAFNAELADESTWLWLTSEQMGFPLRPTGVEEHEERTEDSDCN